METKVEVKNIYKAFNMNAKQSEKLLDLLHITKGKKKSKQFLAIKDVSFKVGKGETVGIVGLNGSGKSTLSNLLAQVIQPSSGEININGETSLIAISAGLNTNLTGMENIELKCMMHGLTKQQIENVRADIIEFADVGDYIYQPVKNYSSGMRSRLGFAISVHTDPDILIVDEALSVGDSTFTQRCLDKMNEFKKQGKTIFFISHSSAQVQSFCDKVIWMHFGQIKEYGDSETVISNYGKFVKWFNKLSDKDKKEHRNKMLNEQIEINNTFKQKAEKKEKSTRIADLIVGTLLSSALMLVGALVVLGYY